ncbi:histone-lysine N-methyltransferase SETMAR [Nephila pilipes]|uniref:Histone-lysine N-methyltransferase SETMAR n=1 Tax=Nephila pilipes TaxID=299642 RepID=A0A8X6IBA5_NEPPI|nr:histone-lysine N-methyltransferase SETMAR [Nephila pilipes]
MRRILQFFFDKGENASQKAEIVNSVRDPEIVTANNEQFWIRRFHSGIFYVKDASRTCRSFVENIDKIIIQELKIDHKTVLRHLRKAGFKKKLNVRVPHQLTQKT